MKKYQPANEKMMHSMDAVRTIAIVSLSSGILGESFVRFEVEIGLRRLREYGLNVKFMSNALKGTEYVKAHG